MKRLSKKFKKCGFNFKQIERTENVAIYEKKADTHYGSSYEVIKISKHNGYNLGENFVEPAETYPGNTLWGTHGWTCTSIESAQKKFKGLVDTGENKDVVKLTVRSKPKNTTQPYLTCIVTGMCRPTTEKYLQKKADKLDVSVQELRDHYISKPALSLLSKQHTVLEVQKQLGIKASQPLSADKLNRGLELNGRKRVTVNA